MKVRSVKLVRRPAPEPGYGMYAIIAGSARDPARARALFAYWFRVGDPAQEEEARRMADDAAIFYRLPVRGGIDLIGK